MNIRTDLIHQDILFDRLKEHGDHFINEYSWIVPIDQFVPLFTHKYGGFLSEWEFWIENGGNYFEVHCRNISNMRYIFPLLFKKTVKRPLLNGRTITPSFKH